LLDVFAQSLEPVEFVWGVGDADMADDALSDLFAFAKGLDDLDGLSR